MNNTYLVHHGVKGMKWGVRRYQNYDGTLKHPKGRNKKEKGLTEKQKKYIKRGAIVAGSILAAGIATYTISDLNKKQFLDKTLYTNALFENIESLNDLNANPINIERGHIIKRIVDDPTEDYKNFNKLYATINTKDNAIYKSFFKNVNKDRFQEKYKAIKNIKAPSDKEAVSEFKNLFNTNDVFRKYIIDDLGIYESNNGDISDKTAIKIFDLYTRTLMTNKEASNIYFDNLSKKGFNAIKDYEDSNGKFANTPMIFLNPGDDLIKKGVHKVGKIERQLSFLFL